MMIQHFFKPIYIDPVIQSRTMEKLTKMNDIRKFEIRIAGVDKMSIFKNQNRAVNDILDLCEDFRSPSITINLAKTYKKDKIFII